MASREQAHVVLVGAMGAGKTTIGRSLARVIRRPFVDNDEQLRAATGRTAAQLATHDGADALHENEAALVRGALDEPRPAVIAAAASTVLNPEVRRELKERAVVVWVRADVGSLAERMPRASSRPFADTPAERLVTRQAADRDHLFAQIADIVVDTTADDVETSVARVVERLSDPSTDRGRAGS